MRIAVLRPQVPFARGGAEIFTDRLVDELRARDHDADLVSVPFKWYPGARVLTQAFLWRMLDLDEADGRRIDLVVATKFPSYLVRHADKRVWLVHQFSRPTSSTARRSASSAMQERALRRRGRSSIALPRGGLAPVHDVPERRVSARGVDGARGRGAPAPASGARLPLPGVRELRPLGQPPRSGEADRPPSRGRGARRGLEVVITGEGPDRRRLERLAHDRG